MFTPPDGWRSSSLVIGLAVAGAVASILLATSVGSHNATVISDWLEDRGQVAHTATEKTVKTAIDGLSAFAAFFENSEKVTQQEFDGFAGSLDPAVRLVGIAYLPIVPGDGLDSYIASRRQVDPAFSVVTIDSAGNSVPVAGDRSAYYPVEFFYSGVFLEDVVGEPDVTALSVGFDAGTPEEWRPSLEFSIDDDGPAVSGFVELGAGEMTVPGKSFIVSVPVHDESGAIVGLVAAPMVDFLLAMEVDSSLTQGITWSIGAEVPTGTDSDLPEWTEEIILPGIVWNLRVLPTPDALAELTGVSPWLVAAAGLGITSLVTFLVLLVRQRYQERGRMENLERLAREKDRFLASVSHELRTPLTVVAGLAHELTDRWESFERDEAIELLSMIARQSDEVAAIVEDLLVAARADLGLVRVVSEAVDLRSQVENVLGGFGVELSILGEGHTADADAHRVRQILRNLISNAQRYGGSEIEVRLGSDRENVWVDVADSGQPISLSGRKGLFEAYVTSVDASEPRVGAMGLGLFISHRLAEVQGGDLTYHHDGSFSIFRLSLRPVEKKAVRSAA